MTAPLDAPGREGWRDWLPHEPGTYVRTQLLFAGHHVRLERVGGLPRIVVTDLESGVAHTIAFDEEAYDLSLLPGYEFETETLRFVYSSMTTPRQTFDYDMRAHTRTLRKTQEVPSGHEPADYVTRRLTAVSHDGARVPVSLLHRRTTPLDGSAPLLLYGYGSYGHAIPAAFSTNRLSLVDRGFVYAIAHVRGGSDCGYGWYLDGKRAKKTNTFADFIAAAEHLIADGYTAKGRIAAHGGSAGGMLMGAVANMRPDLFASIVAEVPFVDVLNTMCDADLPLTPPEWPEWGNPIEDADAYRTIAGLRALRERARPGLPSDLRDRRAHRPARDLLGASEVGGEAAPPQGLRQAAAATHQHGGRGTAAPPAASAGWSRWRWRMRSSSPSQERRGSRLPEAPAVHRAPVEVEPFPRLCILKRVVGPQLSRRHEAGDETGFLAVDQRVRAAVPRAPLALYEAEQVDQEPGDVTHVVDDVLKPPSSSRSCRSSMGLIGVVGHQARLIGAIRPGLLVVHDVRDFVIVRPRAVLFDVVAPRGQGFDLVIRQDREESEWTTVWL